MPPGQSPFHGGMNARISSPRMRTQPANRPVSKYRNGESTVIGSNHYPRILRSVSAPDELASRINQAKRPSGSDKQVLISLQDAPNTNALCMVKGNLVSVQPGIHGRHQGIQWPNLRRVPGGESQLKIPIGQARSQEAA